LKTKRPDADTAFPDTTNSMAQRRVIQAEEESEEESDY